MIPLIQQLKNKNPDLKSAEIEGVLYILKNRPSQGQEQEFAELVKLTGLPQETLKKLLDSLGNALESVKEELTPFNWRLVNYEDSKAEAKLKGVLEDNSLNPKREFDQFFCTPNTSYAKAKILQEKGLITGKSIALLGDDDWVSAAIPLVDDKYQKITVFDIDDRLLAALETKHKELGTKSIQFVKYDARDDLSAQFTGIFDVVITDPPYTRHGVDLFLNRAIQMAKEPKDYSGPHIFLYFGTSFKTPEKVLKTQEIVGKYKLVIEDKVDKFARYNGAQSLGSASSLYILKLTPFTAATQMSASDHIYTYQSQKEEKFPYVDHYVFKIFEVDNGLIKSKGKLSQALGEFCTRHRLKVVDTKVTKFTRQGLSFTYVLSSSNLSVHTWPEHGAIHMDLVTCAPIYGKEGFAESVREIFRTQRFEIVRVE